ncbi:uncharacterized protein LOC114828487 [Galendromus occidentalis]|uniref:Uncharacterized protein LOC114828487 n=1 Tax=Galendromus occidentalis TaxID=34638 RepID=A0AAJ7WIS3_9ACAR|nr:uncharacterized protein LOC114828487 [Galendromus occidentalis]
MQNFYNFTAQDVFTLPASTDKISVAPDKLLVTSLTKVMLRVLDLGEKGVETHSFETRSVVDELAYCEANNHIATVEGKILQVYRSWWSDLRLTTIGVAVCFAWCKTSGRLAVFDGRKITVYEDLEPSFEVHGVEEVEQIRLSENVVALSTSKFTLVFTLLEEKYETPDDEIIWNFDSPDLIVNRQSLSSLTSTEGGSRSEVPEDFNEAYRPGRPIYGLNITVENLCSHSKYQAKVILFKRVQPHFMQLVSYVNRSEEKNQDPLSPEKGEVEYVTLIIAHGNKCELFGVLGADARGELELPEKPGSLAVDECFLHILTPSMLRTYSVPIPGITKDWDPFLLSTHLMSMNCLLMSQDHLVVVSGRDMGDVTVYSLLKPTTSEFYGDLVLSRDRVVLRRAEDVVRLQVRVHGEACSERLLEFYRRIEDAAPRLTIDAALRNSSPDSGVVEEALENSDIRELLTEEGFLTELGSTLLCKYPSMLPLVLNKCTYISPKVLREKIAVATPDIAMAICDYVCNHLHRGGEAGKLHKRMITRNIPDWVYELPPFDGRGPDAKCKEEENCVCLRCTAGLLYGVVVLASAPKKIRHEVLMPELLDESSIPDLLKLACLLPLSKSSSADPEDFEPVSGIIVRLAQKYTKTSQPLAQHLLTALSDVLSLTDFLKCVPESSPSLLPWVQNGLMRERARKLKQEIVSLGTEIRPLLP